MNELRHYLTYLVWHSYGLSLVHHYRFPQQMGTNYKSHTGKSDIS